jgi:hypothetical protein
MSLTSDTKLLVRFVFAEHHAPTEAPLLLGSVGGRPYEVIELDWREQRLVAAIALSRGHTTTQDVQSIAYRHLRKESSSRRARQLAVDSLERKLGDRGYGRHFRPYRRASESADRDRQGTLTLRDTEVDVWSLLVAPEPQLQATATSLQLQLDGGRGTLVRSAVHSHWPQEVRRNLDRVLDRLVGAPPVEQVQAATRDDFYRLTIEALANALQQPPTTLSMLSILAARDPRATRPSETAEQVRQAMRELVAQGWLLRRLTLVSTEARLKEELDRIAEWEESGADLRLEVRVLVEPPSLALSAIVLGDDVAFLGLEDPRDFTVHDGMRLTGPRSAAFVNRYFESVWSDSARVFALRRQTGVDPLAVEAVRSRLASQGGPA